MSFVANFAKKTVAKAMDLFSTNFDNLQVSQALKSPDASVVIAAIKHILANMTIGKDMSGHFNDVAKLVDGQALYTVMCHEDGGIVDDLGRARGHGDGIGIGPAVARGDEAHMFKPEIQHRARGGADILAHLRAREHHQRGRSEFRVQCAHG